MDTFETRKQATHWVAQFASLIMVDTTDRDEVRRRVVSARELRARVPDVGGLLGPQDAELVATLS